MPLAIQTHSLTKRFLKDTGWRNAFSRQLDRPAVDRVDLSIPPAQIYGFLGPNGSGKTTTIRMLLGLLEPTRGSCSILGHDSADLPPQVRR